MEKETTNTTTLRQSIKNCLVDFNNYEMHLSCDEAADRIINAFENSINDLVVEERINHRSICSRTIRKIKENILYPSLDPNVERVAPEPN